MIQIQDTIRSQRKSLGRIAKKILDVAAEINQAIPGLVDDVTVAGLYAEKAQQRLLEAETKLEDARKRFVDKPGRAKS